MSEVSQLLTTIKRQLKLQGKTYRDVAAALKLSEASVKRLLTSDTLGVDRLVEISNMLGFTLAELAQEAAVTETAAAHAHAGAGKGAGVGYAAAAGGRVRAEPLDAAGHPGRLPADAKPECLQKLLHLDRLHLIALMPGNRIRLNVARDFDWLPDGPIRQYFRTEGLNDFLDSGFDKPEQSLAFTHGMLTESALAAHAGRAAPAARPLRRAARGKPGLAAAQAPRQRLLLALARVGAGRVHGAAALTRGFTGPPPRRRRPSRLFVHDWKLLCRWHELQHTGPAYVRQNRPTKCRDKMMVDLCDIGQIGLRANG